MFACPSSLLRRAQGTSRQRVSRPFHGPPAIDVFHSRIVVVALGGELVPVPHFEAPVHVTSHRLSSRSLARTRDKRNFYHAHVHQPKSHTPCVLNVSTSSSFVPTSRSISALTAKVRQYNMSSSVCSNCHTALNNHMPHLSQHDGGRWMRQSWPDGNIITWPSSLTQAIPSSELNARSGEIGLG